jgi:hypothetical protein
MQEKFCQSCAMPLTDPETLGTNADGTKNGEYCKYCYENGEFTQKCTMDEMIEFCVPHMAAGNPGMSEDDARKSMRQFFPNLKRWKQK